MSDEFTPEWAKHAIWYQIFPERFANGDPSNDPTPESLIGARAGPTEGWQVHPWTSDWYAPQPYERRAGGDIWEHLPHRRYGGDLAGILQRLDYLQELGVNALYLNPVFASPSHHKYDAATHIHIDPHFGPDPSGDRAIIARERPDDPATWQWTSADRLALGLMAEVHRRGMHLIFDGVWNHVGVNHWAYRDVLERQQALALRGLVQAQRL